MLLENSKCNTRNNAVFIGWAFLLISVFTATVAILFLNSGHFTYTLDDPYIHLAMSENILSGHYGVNLNEFSAPSSSILWPLLLAPFSHMFFAEWMPFLINILSALATVYYFSKVLDRSILVEDAKIKTILSAIYIILFILVTNLIGLIFTGMEHSLQVLLVVMITWGLISEIETEKVGVWLAIAIVSAPLIRYENLAISAAALLYLFLRRHYKLSVLLGGILILSMGSFSIFLSNLGLELFPTSVIAKSSVVAGNVNPLRVFINNIDSGRGILLVIGMLFLMSYALLSNKNKAERLFSGCISMAICLHLFVGRIGWYNRYEIYIWTFEILAIIYLSKGMLANIIKENCRGNCVLKLIILSNACAFLICASYILDLKTIPIASNNIYQQQYQIHRFVVDYYKKPVAVNDLGYVSFRNENYILDLWGLGSLEALKWRRGRGNSEWMNKMSKDKNVRLAIIYDNWFNKVPENWKKMGTLHLGRRRITAGQDEASFYALDDNTYKQATGLLLKFQETLPRGVKFRLSESII